MNSKVVLTLALVVAAIIGVAVWFLQSSPPLTGLPSALNATPAATSGTGETTWGSRSTGSAGSFEKAPVAEMRPAGAPPPPMADWEIKIQQVLEANPENSDASNLATAQTLINLLPTLPPDGQAEAAQHLLNLLPDSEYGRVLPIVKNPAMPEEVLDVFVTELMNREDPVKLPTLLEIAKIPNHPHHEEAMTDLEIFLDDDFGTNWSKWDAALKTYLKNQAAENAAETATPSALVPAPR